MDIDLSECDTAVYDSLPDENREASLELPDANGILSAEPLNAVA